MYNPNTQMTILRSINVTGNVSAKNAGCLTSDDKFPSYRTLMYTNSCTGPIIVFLSLIVHQIEG